jgi:dTDP-4-amino-4,6-dideoxygalactose transaminase
MANADMPAMAGGTPVLPRPASWPPPVSDETLRLVRQALESGKLAGNDAPGRSVLERHKAVDRGWEYAIACASGTDALTLAVMVELAMRGRDWCRGRTKLGAPTFTCVPGTLYGPRRAVLDVLEIPPEFELFDVRETDWTVDEHAVVRWLDKQADRVLALVIPSLLDTWAPMDSLVPAARDRGVPIIHDGAQCGGGRHDGPKPDADTESLQLENLGGTTTGEGGLYFTDDPVKALLARRITDCGRHPRGTLDPSVLAGLGGIELPLCPNMRMSALVGAAGLGRAIELRRGLELNTIRQVRLELGTEIAAPDDVVLFRTPPMRPAWRSGPTYGVGLEVTEEGQAATGLEADHWQQILAAEGFAPPGYEYGLRRPYEPAHGHPQWRRVVPTGDFPRADRIVNRGLMLHVGHLGHRHTPRYLAEAVGRTLRHLGAVRAHLGVE